MRSSVHTRLLCALLAICVLPAYAGASAPKRKKPATRAARRVPPKAASHQKPSRRTPAGRTELPESTPIRRKAPIDADTSTIGDVSAAMGVTADRLRDDFAAMQTFRPSFPFWRYVFTIPDGSIAFGSATDGRLLGTMSASGDVSTAMWTDPDLTTVVDSDPLPARASDRRDAVADRLATAIGPVVHNPTRGLFVQPNAQRYGGFLDEWRRIYERFGIPGDLGLAQALVESGFNGAAKSEAGAIGLCQWMPRNWHRLQDFAGAPIEAQNQTTQAAYCAAYLTVLAARYGSFIPALSEHHSGSVNVGRIVINGERLGGESVRERYFLGSDFAHDVRLASPGAYSDVYGTYGPRSFRYAEMIFGNAATVADIAATTPQQRVFAMRAPRDLTLVEIARKTRLSTEEVRRFNPALVRRVRSGTPLYLPTYVPAFGSDISFWHRPANGAYASALNDFLGIDVTLSDWDAPAFDTVLERFRDRFAGSRSEEGGIFATVLDYVLEDRRDGRHGAALQEFRASEHIQQMFEDARQVRDAYRQSSMHTD